MNKLLLIGIDSLAPELLLKYEADLPNFTRLRRQSPAIKSTSVFPVDSIPAWVSIYTGQNPARHGIVKSFDIFDSGLADILKIDQHTFQGQTFWDLAGKAGKRVCVLFPLLCFPPWDVNGIMVSRGLTETRLQGEESWVVEKPVKAFPQDMESHYTLPSRGVHGGHPGMKNLAAFVRHCEQNLLQEAALSIRISRENPWDLFFVSLDTLDIVQHRLWSFIDENDPEYPGITPLQESVRHYYRLLDDVIGQFMALHMDAVTVVFSDHGHGIRPYRTVNLNEVLRRSGLLVSISGKYNPLPFLLEKAKNGLLNFTRKSGLDSLLVKLATRTRGISSLSKSLYMSTAYLDRRRTVAYLSSFAGIKSYSHGGIEIEKKNLAGRDYEKVRETLIKLFSGLKDPKTAENLLQWVCRREDLYPGDKVALAYPDIVFELREGYATGWGIHTGIFGKAQDHRLAPGGHKKNAVFLINNQDRQPAAAEMTLMDIAPTVLDLLGVKGEYHFDGASIFKS